MIEVTELERTLQSLSCGQKRVLRKHPLGKDINETDVFYFNADFTDPRAKVHINSIQAKETVSTSVSHRDLSLTPLTARGIETCTDAYRQ